MADNQIHFIELLKKAIQANINIAEEVSSVLNISADSAYRRLRCETEITLNETIILCNHFDIPLDSLNSDRPDSVSFRIHKLSDDFDSFIGYLDALKLDIEWMAKAKQKQIVYAAEDLPVFYSFFFPALARFKLAYWNKSVQNIAEMQTLMVEDINIPENWHEKVQGIVSNFLNVGSTEIWNEDTLKSTIRQIRFYWEAGFFRNKETAIEVISDLMNIVTLIKNQCDLGKKMNFYKGAYTDADYTLYISDLMIGSNCVMMHADNRTASYIGYNTFNYMRTSNSSFNEQENKWMQNQISKSTLISKVSEKQRNQFIKELQSQVKQLEDFVDTN